MSVLWLISVNKTDTKKWTCIHAREAIVQEIESNSTIYVYFVMKCIDDIDNNQLN